MYFPYAKFLFFCILICAFCACTTSLPSEIEVELTSLPEKIDYNFHVKPILSDRCFACHGPDAQKREADLRLDVEASAYAALSSGDGKAIVPNNIKHSQLVSRILTEKEDVIMPPPESNLSLDAREKAILIKWIQQGAVYKLHWAFMKPQESEVPAAGENWAKNEIDHFIASKLQENGIEPAPEAHREQLIRRVYFDMIGLPPSLGDLNKWMKDERTDYYEHLVDSLLELPAFGERMAAHWLDVARFADSEGYLDDFHHTFWPYRDWVIQAFNDNLPYDKFIQWQVGGDQMPNATKDQILATSFNRNHKQNSEGGIIPEEFRVEYVADRTNTVGAAFLGLTLGCARCHDHKYDPISQENYYQLFGFFNSTVERGDGIFSKNSIENGQMVSNKLSMNAGPVLALPDEKIESVRSFLLEQIEKKQAEIALAAKNNTASFENWKQTNVGETVLEEVVEKYTVSHLTFDKMGNGKDLDLANSQKPRYWGSIEPTVGKKGQALRSNAHGQYIADGTKSAFERVEPFTISFWIKTPKEFEEAHVMYNGNNRIQGYRGWDIMLDSSRVHFRLNHAHPYQSIDIRSSEPLPLNEWVHFVWTYDGSSQAEGMNLYRDGQKIQPEIIRNYLYRSTKPYKDLEGTVYMAYLGIVIGNRHYDQDFTGGMIDEVQILNREADEIVAQYLYDPVQGKKLFQQSLQANGERIDRFYDLMIDESLEQQKMAMREIQLKEVQTIDTVKEIMVMGDWINERPTYVLDRGVYDAHGKQVKRDVPTDILPWPDSLPRNRYGLGQWLTHPDHPLTARVAVNQIWYLMFGRGIVETVEDLGNQGALPSHPELLDWLALDFQKNGWDLKRLIKQMVCSATYRQSSKIRPELQEIDPDNYLLARGQRYRRSAEMVRDNVLAVSGLLNQKVGGPSVFPYQPDGLWKEVMTHPFFPEYEVDEEKGLYRRSIYTFWKRNMPPPSMLIFDAASRAECQVRRLNSSTPSQALVLLNDPQVLEACRVLAENVWMSADGNIKKASEYAFRVLTSRLPTDRELQILLEQYQDELAYFEENPQDHLTYLDIGYKKVAKGLPAGQIAALARVTNTILNSTEGYYKN